MGAIFCNQFRFIDAEKSEQVLLTPSWVAVRQVELVKHWQAHSYCESTQNKSASLNFVFGGAKSASSNIAMRIADVKKRQTNTRSVIRENITRMTRFYKINES